MPEPAAEAQAPPQFRERLRRSLDASAWFGVGALGALLFGIGVYIPALATVAYAEYLRFLFAVAGGAVAMLGFSFGWEGRHDPPRPTSRRRAVAPAPPGAPPFGPSFEVYRPPPRQDGPLLRKGSPPPE